jgi:hypothetical protein
MFDSKIFSSPVLSQQNLNVHPLQVYEKTPSTTLNADEAVSRGCALQCAILSPTFKVGTEGTVCTHTWYSVSRGCELQCAILSPTFKVGTGNSLYPYLVQCQGLCATVSHPQSYIQGRDREQSVPIPGTVSGAVRYSAPSSVLHSR